MRRCRSKPLVIALIITMVGAYAQPAFAHNEKVHRDMTDYAYEVMLAASKFANGEPLPPDLESLFKRLQDEIPVMGLIYLGAAQAVPKLRAMPSGLPPDGKPCATPFLINLFGGLFPDFNLPPGTTLADTPLSGVRLPVSTLYSNKNVVCGIDEQWAPSGALADVNPGTFTQRDHTGVTLGYWAGQPDRESGDWRMRSTVLEELKDPANVAGAVAKTTVQISLLCGLACALMPLACLACPILAGGAAGFVADELSSINASQIESPDFCVLGHFMDLKPTPAASFDDVKGKLAPASGVGQPDALDKLLIATYDAMGLHVNHEASTGPTRYEIVLGTAGATGTDLHRNSLERKPSDWETPLASALEYTPGDNLARFGLEEFRAEAGNPLGTIRLGWPLHALGDATVPMMSLGASGLGKRPYEQSIENNWDVLVGSGNRGQSLATITQVITRALYWRVIIQIWRMQNGTGTDIPIRDLVTGLSAQALTKAAAVPTVFKSIESVKWQIGEKGQAEAAFETAAIQTLQADLVIDGIAASLAVMMAATDSLP